MELTNKIKSIKDVNILIREIATLQFTYGIFPVKWRLENLDKTSFSFGDCELEDLCEYIARLAHFTQKRHKVQKEEYIRHVERVVSLVKEVTPKEFFFEHFLELKCVAWLHDVVEDSSITLQDLEDLNISNSIIEAVGRLTKCDEQSYYNYLCGVAANPLSRYVKIADLKDNSSDLTDKKYKHLLEKYKLSQDLLLSENFVNLAISRQDRLIYSNSDMSEG